MIGKWIPWQTHYPWQTINLASTTTLKTAYWRKQLCLNPHYLMSAYLVTGFWWCGRGFAFFLIRVYMLYLLWICTQQFILLCIDICITFIVFIPMSLFLWSIINTSINLVDICRCCFLFCLFPRLRHNLCGPGKTSLFKMIYAVGVSCFVAFSVFSTVCAEPLPPEQRRCPAGKILGPKAQDMFHSFVLNK